MKISFSVQKGEHYRKKDLEFVHGFILFAANKLMRKSTVDKVKLNVQFNKKVKHKNGNSVVNGVCLWDDSNFRPKEFTIVIATKHRSLYEVVESIGHEMVHLKQFVTSELFQYARTPNMLSFKGKIYDMNNPNFNYWETDWEIEAYGKMIGLVHMYIDHIKFNKVGRLRRDFLQPKG